MGFSTLRLFSNNYVRIDVALSALALFDIRKYVVQDFDPKPLVARGMGLYIDPLGTTSLLASLLVAFYFVSLTFSFLFVVFLRVSALVLPPPYRPPALPPLPCLTLSSVESAPFKLTAEFVDLMDGPSSACFKEFREVRM